MAKRTKDEEIAQTETAPGATPTTEQQPTVDQETVIEGAQPPIDQPAEIEGHETPAADAPAGEIAPPCVAFNLLREKNPGDYPEWEGLSDKERETFIDLFNRVDEEEIQGNPYVQCVKEVLNNV